MCGIAGFYNHTVSQDQVESLIKKLSHRGPDDQRSYTHNQVGLIHTRLSIIELSNLGAQPFRFENLVVAFNGELYNYKEVREELKKKGYTFQTNSDTEVLIKAFHCWREKCVSRFIGMFAFAVYDETADEIWIFRDRLGVKPLYYSLENKTLLFASELKALTVLQGDNSIDQDSVYFYFRFGFVPGSKSIYKSIKKLEAGHYLHVNRDSVQLTKYWQPEFKIDHSKSEAQWLEELEELMISAFRYRMVSDVPVGVFLSGGIDSSLLAAILQKHYGTINSFTIGFRESAFDESPHAQKIADFLKINHTHKTLELEEAKNILLSFYKIYDEPFADTSGIPTSCVTQLAKAHGMKVVLSADAGDELFAGYTHYQKADKLYATLKNMPAGLRKALAGISGSILPKKLREQIYSFNLEHKLYATEELLRAEDPTSFFEAFQANQSTQEIANLTGYRPTVDYLAQPLPDNIPLQHMMRWDLQHYLTDDLLVKVDRATMYHGLECREPFLDHRLVELAMRMPVSLKIKEGKNKYIVRKLLGKYIPDHFFERKKQGFSIPIFQWFSKELDIMFKTYLDPERLSKVPVFNVDEVQKEYKKYKHYKSQNRPYNIEKMWRILSFMLWWENYQEHAA
jgi:asparagine synthase (glutamine-hydrolysing)